MKIAALLKKTLLLYVLLIGFFTVSLTLVCALPGERIENNIRESLPILLKEGDYPYLGGTHGNFILDNFTDSIMLNIIYNVDPAKPFVSAIQNNRFVAQDLTNNEKNLGVRSLQIQLDRNEDANSAYPRYWHGYMLYVRPLLLLFPYPDIRWILGFVVLMLFTVIVSLLQKNFGLPIALALSLSMALVNFWIIPFSMQYASVFLIAFVAMVVILAMPRHETEGGTLLFLGIGAFTSFMDLLTAPLLTFGLPAIVWLLFIRKEKPLNTLVNDFSALFLLGIAWLTGYALNWASKWLLASFVLHENVLADAGRTVLSRIGGSIPGTLDDGRPLFIQAILRCSRLIFDQSNRLMWILFFLSLAVIVTLFIFFRRNRRNVNFSLVMLALALLPYTWFAVVSNHSAIHYWYVYRIQAVSIFSVLCAGIIVIDWGSIWRKMSGVFKKCK